LVRDNSETFTAVEAMVKKKKKPIIHARNQFPNLCLGEHGFWYGMQEENMIYRKRKTHLCRSGRIK